MKICHTCQQTYPDHVEFCPRDGARLAARTTDTAAQLAAGLSHRFRIVRRLGAGGMGTVFLAEQIGVGNRPVALKVLNRRYLEDPDFLLRFQSEAASTGRIRHANVVTLHDSGQADDGTPYIAMEFLEGESLGDELRRIGALPVPEIAEILGQAARGLSAAHKLGIIHRDLKPDNIFLARGDEGELIVKIVDFGIAKLRESAVVSITGAVLGTPAYMSYEQASGMRSDELDARSDVYSLGVVAYEMLSGRLPFYADTPIGYLHKHKMEEPPPMRAIAPGFSVPADVEAVVMKALTKNREKRYATALEFAREFARAASAVARAEASTLDPTVKVGTSDQERAEQERLAIEKVQAQRREKERAATDLAARHKADQDRLSRQKREAERGEKEKRAADLAVREKAERERLAQEKAEAERRDERKAAAEVAARDKADRDRLAHGRAEAERREQEKIPTQLAARGDTGHHVRTASKQSSKMKFIAIALVALILIVAGVKHFLPSADVPIAQPSGGLGTAQTVTGEKRPVVEPLVPAPQGPTDSKADAAQRPKQIEAAKNKGDDYYEKGKYDDAIGAYRRGLKLAPSNSPLLQALRRAQTAKAAEERFNQ